MAKEKYTPAPKPKEQTVGKAVMINPPMNEPKYHNSSMLVWPTDKWGFTSDFKAVMIKMASKINGHADKKALFDTTLELAIKHIEAKYKEQSEKNKVMSSASGDESGN